ncbi:MAG: hypothetical protein K2K38_01405 [Clostridia bacterium]|nr:hypothetical protein [Clostridia bacterium]
MAQLTEENLLKAIKKDDMKAFGALMEKAQCGVYRLGRFPVLSLLYLYKSRKILSAYEEKFLKITNFNALREPVEISKKFSAKAGKCLRLYLDEVVSPLEMLLILDKTRRLKRVYPLTKPSAAVKERLKSIYSIKYSLKVEFVGDDILIDRRPLSYREKKNILTACLCSVLVVSVAVCVPVTVNAFKIDFTSQNEYILKRDIVLTKSVEEVNCKIIGNGHKLIVKNGATLGNLNGKISDLTIESSGEVLFTSVSQNSVIENVKVNINADFSTSEATALVAETNFGTIDGVTVNVSGKINALATSTEGIEELDFGGIVLINAYKNDAAFGTIKNCTVNYSDFSLKGEAGANATFGGVAGINNGYLQDCTVTGEIVSDTFDVAGVCAVNNGVLSGNINKADLLQTSENAGWNPIISGIVLRNIGTIQKCKNYGAITVEGIGAAYAGGIAAQSCGGISYCVSAGDIAATAKSLFVGGILGCSEIAKVYTSDGTTYYFGVTDHCISESKIQVTATGDDPARAGGIVGFISQEKLPSNSSVVYLGGCVTNCYFIGECVKEISYFGNIVGVSGANIYESNLNLSGNPKHNFDGNYYLDNSSFNALGMTITEDGNYISAEDKGATAASLADIQNSEGYKAILTALESLLG